MRWWLLLKLLGIGVVALGLLLAAIATVCGIAEERAVKRLRNQNKDKR